MFRITSRREPQRLAPAASMAPAALRFGERPTAARVVRRRLLSRLDDAVTARATRARVAMTRDPLNLQGGRLRPPLRLAGAR